MLCRLQLLMRGGRRCRGTGEHAGQAAQQLPHRHLVQPLELLSGAVGGVHEDVCALPLVPRGWTSDLVTLGNACTEMGTVSVCTRP